MRLATAALLAFAIPMTPQESPVLKVTTRLVQVNVIVRDKKGPVADLKKEDFTLFEQGKPRTIATFSVASSVAAASQKPLANLPSNIFSNIMDRSAAAATNVTVVLLDGLNTSLTDQAMARKAVIRFLESIQRGDRIALYVLGSSLKVLHDFTGDYDQLRAAIARSKGVSMGHLDASEPEAAASGSDAIDDFLNASNQTISDFYTTDRVRRTTAALETIARHISSVPGRKNLIWVSGSFPFSIGMEVPVGGTNEHRTFVEEIQRATRRLNEANVAVYPVDARGLVAMPPQLTASAPNRTTRPGPPPKINFLPKGLDTMEEIASRTGGRAFFNTNDLEGAMRKAVEDAEVTYTLSFYSNPDNWDNKFHELKVKVARSGVDVRHRKGYLAMEQPPRTDKQLVAEFRAAAAGPLDLTEIAISTRADVVNDPKPGTLHLTILIDAHDLQIEKKDDKWTGKAELMIVQVGQDEKLLANYSEAFDIHLTDEQHKVMMQRGILIAKKIEPAKEVKQVRLLVLDRMSGKIGSVRFPVTRILAAQPAPPK